MIYQTTKSTSLEQIVLTRHLGLEFCDELQIISGYIGPYPVGKLSELPFNTKVVYGMYPSSGIKHAEHDKYLEINQNISNTDIYYSTQPIHSKLYLWKFENNIVSSLLGSANFTFASLNSLNRELLTDVNENNFNGLIKYSQMVFRNSLSCADVDLSKKNHEQHLNNSLADPGICKMPLYDPKTNEVQISHGLNWGQNVQNHTKKSDGCIPIRVKHLQNYPDLFPIKQGYSLSPGGKLQRTNDPIEILFDDGKVMTCVLEGSQQVDGKTFPKQIASFPEKSTMGEYFRTRLGLDNHQSVQKHHLNSYGRDSIDLTLIKEGFYRIDFSVQT